jgi:hypothetical protein
LKLLNDRAHQERLALYQGSLDRVQGGVGSKLCADFCDQCIERELCLIFSIHTLILAHPEILRCTQLNWV